MTRKIKHRFRRFRYNNLAHYPNLFYTLDIAVEGLKILLFASIFVAIFYLM